MVSLYKYTVALYRDLLCKITWTCHPFDSAFAFSVGHKFLCLGDALYESLSEVFTLIYAYHHMLFPALHVELCSKA